MPGRVRVALAVLLFLVPLVPVGQAAPCEASSYEDRELAAGHHVVLALDVCRETASGRVHAMARVTDGDPRSASWQNVTHVTVEHDRAGARDGPFAVRDHVLVQSYGTMIDANYTAARSWSGVTTCRLILALALPRSNGTFESELPTCVPMDLLLA